MLTAHLTACGLRLVVYYAEGSDHPNQDRWLAQPLSSQLLRVGVIDGVTPWRSPDRPGDPGQWAAATCLAALTLPVPLTEALESSNRALYDPEVTPARRQAMAALCAADLSASGSCVVGQVAIAADCELWAIDAAGHWSLTAGGDHLTPSTRADWERRRYLWHGLPFDQRVELEAAVTEDLATQRCHAVGRYPAPRFASTWVAAPTLVLASDGACLPPDPLRGPSTDLEAWVGDRCARTPRDDLTCIVVRPER